jgi:hypothetical protein
MILRGIEKVGVIEKTILLSITSFITIMIILPVIYMVYIAMTIGIMPVLNFLLALPAVSLIPLIMMAFKNHKEDSAINISNYAKA